MDESLLEHKQCLSETTYLTRSKAASENDNAAILTMLAKDVDFGIRAIVAQNVLVPQNVLRDLLRDDDDYVRRCARRNVTATPMMKFVSFLLGAY